MTATLTKYTADDASRMRHAVSVTGTEDDFIRCVSLGDPGAKDVTIALPVCGDSAVEYGFSLRKESDDSLVDSVGAETTTIWERNNNGQGATLSCPGGFPVYLAIHPSNSAASQTIHISWPVGIWADPPGEGYARDVVALDADGELAANEITAPLSDVDDGLRAWGEIEVSATMERATSSEDRCLADLLSGGGGSGDGDRKLVKIIAPGGDTFERLAPDAMDTSGNVTGAVGDVQESPDAPDGSAVVLTHVFTNAVATFDFPTPSVNPATGADEQAFRLWVKWNGSGVATFWLGESDSTIGIIGDASTIGIGTDYEMVELTWDAADLGTADGSEVQLVVECSSGAVITIDALEWVAPLGPAGPNLRLAHYSEDEDLINSDADEGDGSAWVAPFTARGRWSYGGLMEDRDQYAGAHYSEDEGATHVSGYGMDAPWTFTYGGDPYSTLNIGWLDDAEGTGHTEQHAPGLYSRVRLSSRERPLDPAPGSLVLFGDGPDESGTV